MIVPSVLFELQSCCLRRYLSNATCHYPIPFSSLVNRNTMDHVGLTIKIYQNDQRSKGLLPPPKRFKQKIPKKFVGSFLCCRCCDPCFAITTHSQPSLCQDHPVRSASLSSDKESALRPAWVYQIPLVCHHYPLDDSL